MLPQLIVSGLATGSVYALIALAMVIVYKTSEVPNFAQGEMAMISAYLAFALLTALGWPVSGALAGALVGAFGIGVVFEFAVLRRAKEPTLLNLIILTLGFQLVLYGLAGWIWGGDQRLFPFPLSDHEAVVLGPVRVSELDLATLATALALVGLVFALVRFTRFGLAMQATQQNEAAARINGIRTRRVLLLTFGISSVVGAVAAMLIAPVTTLDPNLMWDPLLKGFAAAVLGGMTSLGGAVAGGLLLGVIENLFGAYVSLEFRSVVAFALIVAVLWFRPSGLFAPHYERRV